MKRRTPLKRGKPLQRKPRGPAQQPPKPSKSPDMPVEIRKVIYARAQGRCEVSATEECRARGGRFDAVTGRSIHHRRPRRMGGTRALDIHDPANLLAVCGVGALGGCHGFIERNRTLALENGWLLSSGADPKSRAVTVRGGAIVLLQAHGYVLLFHPDGRAA